MLRDHKNTKINKIEQSFWITLIIKDLTYNLIIYENYYYLNINSNCSNIVT